MIGNSIVKSPVTSVILRAILLLSFVVLIVLIFYVYHEGAWKSVIIYYNKQFFELRKLKTFIASFGPYSGLVFVLVQAMQVVVAPVPGEATGFIGGLLFGKLLGVILSTIGLTLGALAAFRIARIFGATLVKRIVSKEHIEKFDHFVTHKGLFITVILFLVPGFPKDSLCYLLGLTHMTYRHFILLNVFGRLPGTIVLCLQGDAIRNARFKSFLVFLAVSLFLTGGLYLARGPILKLCGYCRRFITEKEGRKVPWLFPFRAGRQSVP